MTEIQPRLTREAVHQWLSEGDPDDTYVALADALTATGGAAGMVGGGDADEFTRLVARVIEAANDDLLFGDVRVRVEPVVDLETLRAGDRARVLVETAYDGAGVPLLRLASAVMPALALTADSATVGRDGAMGAVLMVAAHVASVLGAARMASPDMVSPFHAAGPVDTVSSASRQHYIDTGLYLPGGEADQV